jgi:BirA family biotin operon repressor/biotin-[acetyl-CoA-carboxylase] ligase
MFIIKVNATASTNTFAREWCQSNTNISPTCIQAFEQISGRGQRGASWLSNAGENLTFSVIFPNPGVSVQSQFVLSAGVGLALLDALKELKINNLTLKWPNDIMAANYKIGGILIENILNAGKIGTSFIGVGLNVNQLVFPGLPKAASLKSLSARDFDTETVLKRILWQLEKLFNSLNKTSGDEILSRYEKTLFRKNKASTFELPDGNLLTGIIKGITPTGLLKVQLEDDIIKTFDLKELKLLF